MTPKVPVLIARVLSFARELKQRHYPKGKTKNRCLDANQEVCEKFENARNMVCTIQFGWYNGHIHSWVECFIIGTTGTYLIDITADQFDDSIDGVLFGLMVDFPQYKYDDRTE